MASKKTVRIAVSLLLIGGAYDAYYFASKAKRHGAVSPAVTESSSPAAAQPAKRAASEVLTLDNLLQATQTELWQPASLGTRAAHNPFLLAEEERRGMPYDRILKERQREEEQKPKPVAAKPKKPVDENPLSAFQLKAVLWRPSGAVALVNEHLLQRGDRLPGTHWKVEAIEELVVRLRRGKETRELKLEAQRSLQ